MHIPIPVSGFNAYPRPVSPAGAGSLWTCGNATPTINYTLGDGVTADRLTLAQIDVGTLFDDISVGDRAGWARTDGGVWKNWGRNDVGQLGLGAVGARVMITAFSSIYSRVFAGGKTVTLLKPDGTLWGTGFNVLGSVGDGSFTQADSPVLVVGGFSDWDTLPQHTESNEPNTTKGALRGGVPYTWGAGSNGQRADGSTLSSLHTPVNVSGGFSWLAMAVGATHSLFLRSDNTLWSAGRGTEGQLGDGTNTAKQSTMVQVGVDSDWAVIATGPACSYAIKDDGSLWAWGDGLAGRLGLGGTTSFNTPQNVVVGGDNWTAISAGDGAFAFGIKNGGELWSWGDGSSGKLGHGGIGDELSPLRVGVALWLAVACMEQNTVAIQKV